MMFTRFYPPSGKLQWLMFLAIGLENVRGVHADLCIIIVSVLFYSETGDRPPESCVFSFVLSFGAVLGK